MLDGRRGAWRLAALLATMLAETIPARAEAPVPFIMVEGEATADIVPDIAHLALGVAAERATASAATSAAASAAQGVMTALKAEGIADADVATTALTLDPLYDERPNAPNTPRPPRAFRAATTLHVTARQAARVGDIASRLADSGATTIEGIDYAASEQPDRTDALRAAAMRDARHKAEVYTAALGLHLGRVLEINPTGGDLRTPAPMLRTMAVAAKAMPTAPGTLTLHAAVTVRWALD